MSVVITTINEFGEEHDTVVSSVDEAQRSLTRVGYVHTATDANESGTIDVYARSEPDGMCWANVYHNELD